jgi:peptidyl-prolyl cis-trans isomerase D
MVLSLMRKHAKSYLIKFLIAIIAVVFIFYFGYSFRSRTGVKIAYVNGELISGLEYDKTYRDLVEAMRVQYKDLWNDNLIKVLNLKNRALERLINQKLISEEARRLGLEVLESEIQKAIMGYPAFQVNGQFDVRRYRSLLSINHMNPEDFEASMAQDLLQDKVRELLLTFSPVTEQEILDFYTFNNEKIKISFVQFKPETYASSITPDEAATKKYFEAHRDDYRIPEKIKVSYLVIDPVSFRDQVKVTDREIKEYYEDHLDAFKQEKEVRARQILFKVPKNATEAEVKKIEKKAEAVLKEAQEGKDFATLAKKYSEGPAKSKGGDLGYVGAGKMAKPFEEAAFKLKKGEISGLVRTPAGFHIINVEDIKEAGTKSLDEVRPEIKEILVKQASTELADEKALSLVDQMPYEVDLSQYAVQHELKVDYTDYFSQNEPIPGIGGSPELRQGLFSLAGKETSELVDLNGKFYIFQVVDRKASYLPELKEVADKVKTDLTAELAAKEAKAAAEKYLDELQKGKGWDELAKEKNMKPVETGLFGRRGSIPKLGYVPDLVETAFGLNQDKRYSSAVFQNDLGVFVIRWEGREGIDKQKYQEEKEKYRFSLMRARQESIFQEWLGHLRKTARIEIVTPVEG